MENIITAGIIMEEMSTMKLTMVDPIRRTIAGEYSNKKTITTWSGHKWSFFICVCEVQQLRISCHPMQADDKIFKLWVILIKT